jgi:type II secretory pathway component PulK
MSRLRFYNNSAIILMPVIWVLLILVFLAVGLGRRTSIDLTLTRYSVSKMKSYALAWAGLVYSMNEIFYDSEDEDSSVFDSLYQCGFRLRTEENPSDIFKDVPLDDGYFDVGYDIDLDTGEKFFCYGFEDEERRVNLNAVNANNYGVLAQLIILLGFDQETAVTIASSVVDWRDDDDVIFNESYGAEAEYYSSLGAGSFIKNGSFESVDELMLIKGMNVEIFEALEDYVTIFPIESDRLALNMNTASRKVLQAVLRDVAQQMPNALMDNADRAVSKIIQYRQGQDGLPCTSDDRLVERTDFGSLGLLQDEQAIFLTAVSTHAFTQRSQFFRVQVTGKDDALQTITRIRAIVRQDDLTIVFWQRN